jgi:hypothetical protein
MILTECLIGTIADEDVMSFRGNVPSMTPYRSAFGVTVHSSALSKKEGPPIFP